MFNGGVKSKLKIPAFRDLLDAKLGREYIEEVAETKERIDIFKKWYKESGEGGEVYPSQGLLSTPYDYLDVLGKTILSEGELWETLKMRRYVLEIFNHPDRIEALRQVEKSRFVPPPKVESKVLEYAVNSGLALSVRDLGAEVVDGGGKRVGRRKLLAGGPFVKLGKFARIPFASGAMPDVFGSPAALATMAACHGLACVPRNGVFSDMKRQVDLAKAALAWMKLEGLVEDREDGKELVKIWKRNIVGVVEPEVEGGMKRVEAMFEVGVRAFRVYSPEPGDDARKLVNKMRKEWGEAIEIFVGQVAEVKQGLKLQEAGADGLYVGIGGGGRCTTAVRSSSVVNWPILVWRLTEEVKIPVIVEGGGSDHVGVTLLIGASGIGVSRIAAGGTVESPGGLVYWVDKNGRWFKPYGGEASARTKYVDGKVLAMGLPAFVEGETTKAFKGFVPYAKPTLAENVYFLLENVILSLVFRGVTSVPELQALDPSPLRRITAGGAKQQGTH